jgi:hypothetical protein
MRVRLLQMSHMFGSASARGFSNSRTLFGLAIAVLVAVSLAVTPVVTPGFKLLTNCPNITKAYIEGTLGVASSWNQGHIALSNDRTQLYIVYTPGGGAVRIRLAPGYRCLCAGGCTWFFLRLEAYAPVATSVHTLLD